MSKKEQEAKQMIEKWFKDNNKTIQIADINIEEGQKTVNIEYSIGEKDVGLISLKEYSCLANGKVPFFEDHFWEVWNKAISGDKKAQNKIVNALEELIERKCKSKE